MKGLLWLTGDAEHIEWLDVHDFAMQWIEGLTVAIWRLEWLGFRMQDVVAHRGLLNNGVKHNQRY